MPLEFDGVNGIIKNTTSDGDVTIKGNDGGSEISALVFDMSAEGAATFNSTVALTSFAATDGCTITTADNDPQLTLVSTDADGASGPNLTLYRNSSSPADNDQCGRIKFIGRNDNSQDFDASYFTVSSVDVSDGSEDANMEWYVKTAGSDQLKLSMKPTETIFNEASADLDFRVESNGNANMLFVNGGSNLVGIGADPDLGVGLHIKSADSGVSSAGGNADELIIEGSANSGMSILSGTSSSGGIHFGDSDNSNIGMIQYHHGSTNAFVFSANGSEAVRVHSDGSVKIGSAGTATLGKLHIESADSGASVDSNADELVVEGSGSSGISILSGTGNEGAIKFGDSGDNNIGFISYDHAGNDMYIGVNAATRVKVHDNGVAAFNNGVALGVGTANTASNVLDDYEEGTWTPTLSADATATAYSVQIGIYTKIGRMVQVSCEIQMSDVGSFAGATSQVNGLPFTSANNSVDTIGVVQLNATAIATSSDIHVRIPANNSFARIENASGATTTDNNMNANRLDTGTRIRFNAVYSI